MPSGILHALLIRFRVIAEFLIRSSTEAYSRRERKRLNSAFDPFSTCAALVIANGPSADTIIDKEASQGTFARGRNQICIIGMNRFWGSSSISRLSLDFLVLSDSIYLEQDSDLNHGLLEFLRSNPSTGLLVPFGWRKQSFILDLENPTYFFDDRSLELLSKNTKPWRPRGFMTSTALKALAISTTYFKDTFIVGFDNNLFLGLKVTEENRIFQDPNHSSKSHTAGSHEITLRYPNGVADYFFDVARMFKDLELFRRKGITNLDPLSLTNHFPKNQRGLLEWLTHHQDL